MVVPMRLCVLHNIYRQLLHADEIGERVNFVRRVIDVELVVVVIPVPITVVLVLVTFHLHGLAHLWWDAAVGGVEVVCVVALRSRRWLRRAVSALPCYVRLCWARADGCYSQQC
jgi:hypothetical protein